MSRDIEQSLIQALGAAIREEQRAVDALDDAAAAYLGIHRTDLRCLDVLLEQRQATPGSLADVLGLTTGSITALLDRIEKLGYAHRTREKADRRRITVTPTSKATEAARRIWGPIAAESRHLLGRYSNEQLEAFLDFLRWNRRVQETHAARIRRMRRP
jgi:DNA-binding MarR family transcriptional regulator